MLSVISYDIEVQINAPSIYKNSPTTMAKILQRLTILNAAEVVN